MDTKNSMSFFIVLHQGQRKVALRTEGVFQNKGCVTYEVIDTVRESEGYYRFSDFQAGAARAYTEITFGEDAFVMEVYTSRFRTVSPPALHSRWEAELGDRRAAEEAISRFDFPQDVVVRDFSTVSAGRPQSIYFDLEDDPYDASSQPYVGEATVRVFFARELPVVPSQEVFLLLTTQSLFQGLRYEVDNLRYISKYVYMPAHLQSFTFRDVHPGRYYLYAFYDINNDREHTRGDYMTSDIGNTFTLGEEGTVEAEAVIDFVIP